MFRLTSSHHQVYTGEYKNHTFDVFMTIIYTLLCWRVLSLLPGNYPEERIKQHATTVSSRVTSPTNDKRTTNGRKTSVNVTYNKTTTPTVNSVGTNTWKFAGTQQKPKQHWTTNFLEISYKSNHNIHVRYVLNLLILILTLESSTTNNKLLVHCSGINYTFVALHNKILHTKSC